MARWRIYLDQWRRALESGAEVHCLGDYNIDSSKLLGSSGPQHQPLVDAVVNILHGDGSIYDPLIWRITG